MVEKKKKVTGRKPLKEQKRKPYKYYLNDAEYALLVARVKDSVHSTVASYVRSALLDDSSKVSHINPKLFLKTTAALSTEVHRLGTNINQLAHYTNRLALEGKLEPKISTQLSESLKEYHKLQLEIAATLKEILLH